MPHRVRIRPHNDLLNLAHYQRETINNKVNRNEHDAITLDCMACLISLAFSVEALLNFVGTSKIADWQDRWGYRRKRQRICENVSINVDESREPFTTLNTLKTIRDNMAHAQPQESNSRAASREELRQALACPWDQFCTPVFVNSAYERVKEFQRTIFTAYGINIVETLTGSSGAM